MYAFVNGDIFTPSGVLHQHALIVRDGRISKIVKSSRVPLGAKRIDVGGLNIAAGFVDLQVNGGGDVLFNTHFSCDDVRRALKSHQALGTTSIFPTVFTSSISAMEGLLESVIALRLQGVAGVAGIHFEGPVIHPAKAGVHDKDHILPFDSSLMEFYLRSARQVPTLVTLAPEHVDDQAITRLTEAGVLVLAGHTDAGWDRMNSAMRAGLGGATHLFNAMSQFGSREPGVVGAVLANSSAYASIIADGHHVHWASVRAAAMAMQPGHLFAVTDAMPCVGGTGAPFQIGPLEIQMRNGRCETSDGTLAGSALDMGTAVRNLVQQVGIPMGEAVKMANQYPADFARIGDIGQLEPGRRADFVVFDNQVRERTVYISGERLN